MVRPVLVVLEDALCIRVGITLDQVHERVGVHIIATMFGGNFLDSTAGLLLVLDILSSEQGRVAIFCDKAPSSLRCRRADDRHMGLDWLGPGLTFVQREIF